MINQHQLFGTIVKISFYRVSKPCFPPEINRNDPKYFKSEIGNQKAQAGQEIALELAAQAGQEIVTWRWYRPRRRRWSCACDRKIQIITEKYQFMYISKLMIKIQVTAERKKKQKSRKTAYKIKTL